MPKGHNKNGESYKERAITAAKERAITAAKELCYGPEVIAKLEEAETDAQIENIMYDARHGRR